MSVRLTPMKLPGWLRSKIWRAFRPGQEKTKTPSREYVEVAKEAQDWIAANHPPEPEAQGSLGFNEDHSVGTSRSSVKRSHRAEGRNFID